MEGAPLAASAVEIRATATTTTANAAAVILRATPTEMY
jgi:hypothetical protein